MLTAAEKNVRFINRMLRWPREKARRFFNKRDVRALWKLNKYGVGEQIPYAEQLERKKQQIAINRFNEGD